MYPKAFPASPHWRASEVPSPPCGRRGECSTRKKEAPRFRMDGSGKNTEGVHTVRRAGGISCPQRYHRHHTQCGIRRGAAPKGPLPRPANPPRPPSRPRWTRTGRERSLRHHKSGGAPSGAKPNGRATAPNSDGGGPQGGVHSWRATQSSIGLGRPMGEHPSGPPGSSDPLGCGIPKGPHRPFGADEGHGSSGLSGSRESRADASLQRQKASQTKAPRSQISGKDRRRRTEERSPPGTTRP
jgi:hypothetical protein